MGALWGVGRTLQRSSSTRTRTGDMKGLHRLTLATPGVNRSRARPREAKPDGDPEHAAGLVLQYLAGGRVPWPLLGDLW